MPKKFVTRLKSRVDMLDNMLKPNAIKPNTNSLLRRSQSNRLDISRIM